MKLRIAAVLLLLSGSLTAAAGAPAAATSSIQVPDRDAAIARALRLLDENPGLVHGSDGESYTVRDVIIDADGATHVRFERTHRDLAVIAGDFVVHHGPDGVVAEPSVALDRPIEVDTEPSVPEEEAASVAREAFRGTIHEVHPPSLVVDGITGIGELAWETIIEGTGEDEQSMSKLHVLVDAHDGTIQQTFDEYSTGLGNGIHSGSVYIGTTPFWGTNFMIDQAHGSMNTCDMNNSFDFADCYTFVDSDDTWGNGSQSDRASAGVDAHYGAAKTYDYYAAVLGRNGIWGDGKGVKLGVHAGTNWFNATWNGSAARFGDGVGGQDPLVTLDIVGHELSHGVTGATAGLIYNNESGGLNEATSDILGNMVEFFTNNPNDPRDYKVGEELNYFQPNDALRYMYQPSLDGASADCWYNGVGNMDVHYSSGVANHFFFLLAEGSGQSVYGTSPTCNKSKVIGIGRIKAAKIWYRALSTYMVSNETFHKARASTLSAAKDLYGACSTEYMTVMRAWSAVNVGINTWCVKWPYKRFYFVDSCWPCPPIPDPGPLAERIVIEEISNPVIEVGVDIVHERPGDLQIDLISPSGREYRLRSSEPRDAGQDMNEVFTVDLGREAEAGVWMLQITDNVRGASGFLEGWTMLV